MTIKNLELGNITAEDVREAQRQFEEKRQKLAQEKLTHKDVTIAAAKFIKRLFNCPIGAYEFSGGYSNEHCDGFLFNRYGSFMIEAKVSRSDFLADAKKPFRKTPEVGIGTYRFYACPAGLLKLEELPEKWGLIEVYHNKRCVLDFRLTDEEVSEEKEHHENWTKSLAEQGKTIWPFEIKKDIYRFLRKPRQFDVWEDKEKMFLYYLARRYKSGKFPGNIL